MAEKKRKRNEDGSERPAKKAAIAQPKGSVKVEQVENAGDLGPVLAATPGLNFPSKISFKPYKHSKILPGGTSTELLLQSSEHPRLDYTAREEKDGSSESLLKDYVGVYDPATRKLQLVEVKKVTVRSTLRSETEEMREEQAKIEAQRSTMTVKRHALAAEFGSKKSRKAIEDMTMNAISRGKADDPAASSNDGVASNVLQNMKDSTLAMPTQAELAAAVDSSKPRPIANTTAEYAPDVYTADSVVGKELMGLIPVKDWVEASENGTGVQVASKFVAKRISKLVKSKEIQKLKVLRFILLCMNFYASLRVKGRSAARLVPFKDKLQEAMGEDTPEPVVNAIRRKFASENNDMPRWNIDYLMTHIAAAALIVDGYEVDVNDLREDLKLENKEIRQYFHELGCKVSMPTEGDRTKWKITKTEANNHWIAKLKLPLQFPKVKTGPSKRR
ncbi:DNA-directed RNA polymeras-like protein I 49 kDa polypeptide [Corynespora cassiicola Philippines]|uniref:DNA-directed RNA polymeras-like protein I 49 kDa polypeptide n=1 Tax=Corynespora cassiicola Philippines TaxID=1448308 RepID=A0A2T2NZT3_CORCC|nr:DNA-directed RNA polymeras-like protein I 49 kDa polypeptide [Corynespora cassiicola Philippines]